MVEVSFMPSKTTMPTKKPRWSPDRKAGVGADIDMVRLSQLF